MSFHSFVRLFSYLSAGWAVLLMAALCSGCGKKGGEKAADLVLAAQRARADGNRQHAKELLDEAIEIYPRPFCFLERARVLAELGEIDAAAADCARGLELDPDDPELAELLAECRKPAKERFRNGTGLSAGEH